MGNNKNLGNMSKGQVLFAFIGRKVNFSDVISVRFCGVDIFRCKKYVTKCPQSQSQSRSWRLKTVHYIATNNFVRIELA